MQDVLTASWWPLALSMTTATALVAAAVFRVWRQQRRVPSEHANALTARRFAWGFSAAALLWLVYGLLAGYGRFLQPDGARQLVLYAGALWSVPLFIGAIAWAAGVGVGWIFRLLQREAQAPQ